MSDFYKSVDCPHCRCIVVVWKHKGLKVSLLKKLALADHITTMHKPNRHLTR